MADVVVANDDLVVLGGPSSLTVELDIGATGNRGSYIFTDVGKPTAENISFSITPQLNDLFINLNPSDNEYLYLYQYKLDNAVLGWTKILRLVPNTILANPVLRFINGEAHTSLTLAGTTFVVRGLYFPLAGTLENAETEALDYRDINLQYSISSDLPVSAAANLKEINTSFDLEIYDPTIPGYVTQTASLGARYLYATLNAAEVQTDLSLARVNGYRKVDILATVGGRSEQVMDITAVTITDGATFPGSLTVPNHGLSVGSRIAYLSNGNTAIVGLTDQTDYVVAALVTGDEDNSFVLSADGVNPVILTDATVEGTQSVLKFGGLV
jgi:hypothetical protein